MSTTPPLFREQELAFRTQYAELKERTLAADRLLPGTPGSLVLRSGTGHSYWYRVYYPVPARQSEDLVCKLDDTRARDAMGERMDLAAWVSGQVSTLRKLGFQVADKRVARVLVELHNRGAFEAGLVLVGTLAYMAWLNELGAIAVTARTLDIDLARGHPLKLAAPVSFMETLLATRLPFVEVPGLPATAPSTSVKLRGVHGLRVDLLAPGSRLGSVVRVPELGWCAQAIPHYDYLLEEPEPAAMLAGGHCIPVRLPQAARLIWHKLYASSQRSGFPPPVGATPASAPLHSRLKPAMILLSTYGERGTKGAEQRISNLPRHLETRTATARALRPPEPGSATRSAVWSSQDADAPSLTRRAGREWPLGSSISQSLRKHWGT